MSTRSKAATAALSLVAALIPAATAAAAGPSTSLVDLTSTGAKANGASVMVDSSDDGRYVAFTSNASNLLPAGATPRTNVFLRDRARGTTTQVSVGPGGAQPDADVQSVSISGDGRYVAFYSDATTLAATPGGLQAYLWDRTTGLIRRVSTNVAPANTYDVVNHVVVSNDGSAVAYDAVDTQTSRTDVFVADVGTGAVKRAGETAGGAANNGTVTYSAELSGDGKWVGYSSDAGNLVTGDDNAMWDDFVESVATGTRQRVSVATDGGQSNNHSFGISLNRDGCVAAFDSRATNLAAGVALAGTKIFVRDRCQGTTEVASVATNGTPGTANGFPAISLDGCAVAFRTTQIFSPAPAAGAFAVRDRCTGVTTRSDISTAGESSNGQATPGSVRISGTRGRYVPFSSAGTNLDLGDTDATPDAFLRDRADVNVPPHAVASVSASGARVSVDAGSSSDGDGYVVNGAIGFGDGTPEVGSLTASHDYARGGTYTLTVTVTDADGATDRIYQPVTVADPPAPPGPPGGNGGGGGLPPGPDLTDTAPLRLTGVSLARRRFAVAPAQGKPGRGQGTTLRATLSGGAATLTLAVDRAGHGRRSGGRCVKTKKKGARCTSYTSVGSLTRSVKAGSLSVAFSGRLSSGALRSGSYRLRVSARAADGRKSSTTTIPFTIVARSAAR